MTDGMIKRQEELVKKTNEYFVCVVNSIGDKALKKSFLERLKKDVEDAMNQNDIQEKPSTDWSARENGKITKIVSWLFKHSN